MSNEIVLTHPGKLGDFIATIPIAVWLNRYTGKNIHYVLPSTFKPFTKISSLLKLQSWVSNVTIVPFQVESFHICGGQPYKFDPNVYGINCDKYYNLGFRAHPEKCSCIAEYVAEEHGLDFTWDFKLNLGEMPKVVPGMITCLEPFTKNFWPEASVALNYDKSILDNLKALLMGEKFYVFGNGPLFILLMAGIIPDKILISKRRKFIEYFTPPDLLEEVKSRLIIVEEDYVD